MFVLSKFRSNANPRATSTNIALVVTAFVFIAVGGARVANAADDFSGKRLLAIFAHPDEESTVAPILSRYKREGASVIIVIATDGRYGTNDHSEFEAGDGLAEIRSAEKRCSADALGLELIHLDYHDQLRAAEGYDGHMPHVKSLIREIAGIVDRLQPDAIITWGPDGGSNKGVK